MKQAGPAGIDDEYPTLFSPFTLAGKPLKNRIVHSAMSPRFGAKNGIHDSYRQYFVNRARGGAGMIVTDPIGVVSWQGARLAAWNDDLKDDLPRFAEAIESYDCRLLAQFTDSGRGRHVPGRSYIAVGASPLPDDLSYTMPRPLTVQEIRYYIESAAGSAARLKSYGYSGVEMSAGHGHLFHQFLSPRSNRREDEYGGDLAGRCRLLVQLCTAIRAECGKDFILGVKLPGDDGHADSIPPSMAAQIATHLTAAVKIDYLTYAQGTHSQTLEMHIPDDGAPRLVYMGLIRQLRAATPDVPVMALGRITDPAEAEGILVRGDAELIGLGRALVTDAAWPLKAKLGRARDIRYCVSCNSCWKAINAGTHIACDNNPRLCQPDEVAFMPPPTARKKRIVVVGAGIAGLEAAWTAAARGHHVIVFGRSADVGGKTRLNASLPNSESLSSIYDYQYVQAQKAGVQFELGITATARDIIDCEPDDVVLATGSTMTWPLCLPEALHAEAIVPDLREAMAEMVSRAGKARARQRGAAVIFDMDQTDASYAAAELLREIFDRVVVLTPRQGIAEESVLVARQGILRRFHERGIEVMRLVVPHWSESFENEGRLQIASIFGGIVATIDDVAFFSYSTPRAPDNALVEPLLAAGLPVHLIGDCKIARDAMAATAEGSAIGMKL